jgi:hypothetical protein
MAKRTRKHPDLGDLRWDERLPGWEAEVELRPGCPVRLTLITEGRWAVAEPAEVFEAAAAFLARAREFEPRCRVRVADDLLDVYNRSWADDDPEEGPPPLTRAEFLAALRPAAISLHDSGSSRWDYACGDLFAGHGIELLLDAEGSFVGKASLYG